MENMYNNELREILIGDKVIGFNQTMRGIEKKLIDSVVLAQDAESNFKQKVENKCRGENIKIFYVPSGLVLAEFCKIDVPCAVIGILRR